MVCRALRGMLTHMRLWFAGLYGVCSPTCACGLQGSTGYANPHASVVCSMLTHMRLWFAGLYGICTSGVLTGAPLLMLMEYCHQGSLTDYLRVCANFEPPYPLFYTHISRLYEVVLSRFTCVFFHACTHTPKAATYHDTTAMIGHITVGL